MITDFYLNNPDSDTFLDNLLFFQPTTNQINNFLTSRLWEGKNTGLMRTSRTHINMQILLILRKWKSINTRSTPWVDRTIDINHLRIRKSTVCLYNTGENFTSSASFGNINRCKYPFAVLILRYLLNGFV